MPCYKANSSVSLAALGICRVVSVCLQVFMRLSVYFVSFALLFDVGLLGLHFLCAQRVFCLYCMCTLGSSEP